MFQVRVYCIVGQEQEQDAQINSQHDCMLSLEGDHELHYELDYMLEQRENNKSTDSHTPSHDSIDPVVVEYILPIQ